MSMVRLLVLGVMQLKGASHGYAVHKELSSWNIEAWTKVRPGSIYHALKQLHKEAKLSAAGSESSSEGPGRSLYALTESGRAEFFTLLEQALVSVEPAELAAGIAFMQTLPRQRVINLLGTQLERLEAYQSDLGRLMPGFADRRPAPHSLDLLELWSGHLDVTRRWTRDLIARLQKGEYLMAAEHEP